MTFSNLGAKNIASGASSTDPNTQSTGSIQVTILVDANGDGTYNSGDDIASFTIYFINSIPQTTAGNAGLYTFTAYPGDGELVIKSPTIDSSFPAETAGTIQHVNFYYSTTTTGNETATLQTLASAAATAPLTTSYSQVSVDSSGTLSSYNVGNFQNDTKYCLIAGLVDNAGNIGYITDTSNQASAMCATPSQIAGLMSKSGHCFVATAAYGSPMENEVVTLRNFRDTFLLKGKAGRNFVSWYYKHSPKWADKIRSHESAKATARFFLWPAVGFAKLSLKWGPYNASLFFGTLILLPLLFIQFKKSKNILKSRIR